MNRRKVLKGLVTGVAAVSWPVWLRRAFGEVDKPAGKKPSGDLVEQGYKTALKYGRPLLVLVIPQDDGMKYPRGQAFGAYLNHATPEQLYPMALAQVICATMADLRKHFPDAPAGEPMMVLVETDQRPPKPVAIECAPGDPPKNHQDERPIDQVIENLSRAIHDHLAADEAALVRRERQCTGVCGSAFGHDVLDALRTRPERITVKDVRRAAAVVALEAERTRSAPLRAGLARCVEEQLKVKPVPGSRWANDSGCAAQVEGDEPMAIGCGMGHVPAKASRFLYFFARTPLEMFKASCPKK